MNYRSIADLHHDLMGGLHLVPRDVDLIVGIPRSGLLAANMLALLLNLPLADIEGFAEGRLLNSGVSRRRSALDLRFEDLRHVLVLDDSTYTGRAFKEARLKLAHLTDQIKITYAAVYDAGEVDPGDAITFQRLPMPRVFQWNLMGHSVLHRSCVDIDGVLCLDPTEAENDDGAAYVEFLLNAKRLAAPAERIGHLVTSRLEKYRAQTEQWLAQHGVQYEKLIMLDLPSAAERRAAGNHGRFKGEYYRRSDAILFIESEPWQAVEIARISGKDVLCTADQQVYRPDALSPVRILQSVRQSNVRSLSKRLRSTAKKVLGRRSVGWLKQMRTRLS